MQDINLKQFLLTQPDPKRPGSSTPHYLRLANRLLQVWHNRALMQDVPDDLKKVVCIALTGYYQDIISDAGVYRTFTDEHLRMYGYRVPFHADSEDYIDYELNLADVEFVLWYELAFNSMSHRFLYPRDPKLLELARVLYKVLEDEYEEIPDPDGYTYLFDADLLDPADTNKIHDLSQWLFWKNWLLLPPFQLTFTQIYQQWIETQHTSPTPEKAKELIEEDKRKAMSELPTGPLALYLRDWLSLLLTGKLPAKRRRNEAGTKEPHPLYTPFIEFTRGSDIAFVPDYRQLNEFLIEVFGWAKGEEHLPQFKNNRWFVLMVTPHGGLMVAKEIARCVKHPFNPFYDPEYARNFAFNLISQRGVCPGDMLRRLLSEGALPDARFPESDDTQLVADNADFLARAYLQEYYCADI